jgi:VWFA-related protein
MKPLISLRLFLLVTICGLFTAGPAAAQQKTGTIIRSESRLVLVDTVVTDRKGYVNDLTQKDFHVFEDGKEQPLKSFSFEKTPDGKTRDQYYVLFFENQHQRPEDEARIRTAAAKLVQANAGPNRFFAVVNFGTILRVTQNFTSDPELILAAVQGKYLGLSGRLASTSDPELTAVEGDFGAGSVLQGLRSLAKGMSRIQGRKTLIFLSAGFPLAADKYFELQAAIDACNRANVAVYPLDVKGLTVGGRSADSSSELRLPEVPPRWSDGVYRYSGPV